MPSSASTSRSSSSSSSSSSSISSGPSSRGRLKANLRGAAVAALLNPSPANSSKPSVNYAALNRRHIRDTEERRRREKLEADERARAEPFKMLRFQNAESKALKAAEQHKDKSGGRQHYLKKHSREEKEREKMVDVIHKYNHNVANYLQQQRGTNSNGSGDSQHSSANSSRQSSAPLSADGAEEESIYHFSNVNEERHASATHLSSHAPAAEEDDIENVAQQQHFDDDPQEKENAHYQQREAAHHDYGDDANQQLHGYPEDESEAVYGTASAPRSSAPHSPSAAQIRLKSLTKPPVPSTLDTLASERKRLKEKELKKDRDYIKSNAREVIAQSKQNSLPASGLPFSPSSALGTVSTPHHGDYGRVPDYLVARKAEMAAAAEAARVAAEEEKNRPPPGLNRLSEEERLKTLAVLKENFEKVQAELSAFPLRVETVSRKKRKTELETKLQELENAIKLFSRKVVFIKQDQ